MNAICVASVLFVLAILASLILVGVRSASPVKHDNPGIRIRQEAKAAPPKPASARVPQPGVYDSPGIARGRYEKGEAETFFCLTVFFGMLVLLACIEGKVYFDACWGLIQQVIDGLAMAGGLGLVAAVRPGGPLCTFLAQIILVDGDKETVAMIDPTELKAYLNEELMEMVFVYCKDGDRYCSEDHIHFVKQD
jgi:hypothetical protein